MKRILISFVLFSAVLTAWAQNNVLHYTSNIEGNSVWVTNKDAEGHRVSYSGAIVIPDVVTINDVEYSVTGIAAGTFDGNTGITSVVLGKNVSFIGGNAFQNCIGLESITIPASVDTIGAWAFNNAGLKSVKIDDGEIPIKLWDWGGYCVFSGCPLETAYLGRNYISNGRPFRGFRTLQNITVSDFVTSIQDEEFKQSYGVCNVILGSSITRIGNSSFEECDTLSSITLPESVLSIGQNAFYSCDSLSVINIPSQVYLIEGSAFQYCPDLESITIPASVDSIGSWAFCNSGLKNVRIEDSEIPLKLWDWGGYCVFNGCPLESIYLGRNYISNGRPFRGFKTLQNITVSDFVTSIQDEEFKQSYGVCNVILGSSITRIGNSAFEECDTLSSITLPESVRSIGQNAFYSCDSLSVINIPSQVYLIEGSAFQYCPDLESITIPASVDSIGSWAFCNSGLKNVRVEDSEIPLKLWDWGGYCVFNANPLANVYLGRNYISNGRPFRGFKTLQNITVSDFVTSIQDEEFKQSYGVRNVLLGGSITRIGASAFEQCDTLSSITLPESVRSIGQYAFYSCDSLSVINIPSQVYLIEGSAFQYCPDLESITIPASVDSIGSWAFCNSGLKNVRIEDSEIPLKLWDWGGYCVFNANPLANVYLGRNYISNGRPFRGFKTLQNITVSDFVTSIQDEEFKQSYGVRNVLLGGSITRIGNSAFEECDTLSSITLPESVLSIGQNAFYSCDSLSVINIPSQVYLIEGSAFQYCPDLESITIPASVDSIGSWAFCNSGLKNVRIEDSEIPLKLWDWGGYCVFNANPLANVYLGRNYISNGRPFRGFTTIKTATIGSLVNNLQNSEFEGCKGLETIYSLSEIPPTCGSRVFYGVNKETCKLYVPELSIELYKGAYAWNEFFNIEDAVKNILIDGNSAIDNGTWFNMNGQSLDNAKRGMNILRTEDGKAVKVFIK